MSCKRWMIWGGMCVLSLSTVTWSQVSGVISAAGAVCSDNADCDDDRFCAKRPGRCDGNGRCRPRPDSCPGIYAPVCGCDGNTYDNRCLAAAAGVSVDHVGACDVFGKCCVETGQCVETSEEKCDELCGAFAGPGTQCTLLPIDCPMPPILARACCLPNGTCEVTTACQCENRGGVPQETADCSLAVCDGEVCGGIAGIQCSDSDDFCWFPFATCGQGDVQGKCLTPPPICPLFFDPVCGCDGQTYGNVCEAAQAGVSVASDGPCNIEPEVCGGFLGLQCSDSDDYCNFPVGTCGEGDVPGTCEPRPDACYEIYDPVCGCDGQTYGNDCKAAAAGVSILHPGTCENEPDLCGGIANIPCEDPDDYCSFTIGTCGNGDIRGECLPRPEICPLVLDPVCGCDGMTYGNACKAAAAGVSILHPGPCDVEPELCGGFANIQCSDPGDYCAFPLGTCRDGDIPGKCQPRPDACPDVYDPVCGCDRKTYGNACEAAAAGVSVDYPGECDNVPGFCGGLLGIECEGENEFCNFPPGTCGQGDIPGECLERPQFCPLFFDPVCGCDGMTYGNACLAASAGVSVFRDGACENADIGKCCTESMGCMNVTEQECFELCGAFGGAGTACSGLPWDCPIPPIVVSACCLPDGTCEVTTECLCERAGGVFSQGIDCEGACGELCGGITGIQCPSRKQFCRFPDGSCLVSDNQGVCTQIPQGCPEIYDPVCGCDGVTYGNRCEASAAGISVDFTGPCPDPDIGKCCTESGQCLETTEAQCALECGFFAGPGTECIGLPFDCPIPPIFATSCCLPDGTCEILSLCRCELAGGTPGNGIDCETACSGGDVCGGFIGIPCNDGEFCQFPEGMCNSADIFGTCVSVPMFCPLIFAPVCGCDGVTYSNACFAQAAQVSIDHPGQCDVIGLECDTNLDCFVFGSPLQFYCEKSTGDCGGSGLCAAQPQGCPDVWDPVCGCDGVTYGNACEAAAVGVSVASDGECDNPNVPCNSNADCQIFGSPIPFYCQTPVGQCDAEGSCQPVPLVCPDVWDPVCGCNGVTYSNACDAAAEGQTGIAGESACVIPLGEAP